MEEPPILAFICGRNKPTRLLAGRSLSEFLDQSDRSIPASKSLLPIHAPTQFYVQSYYHMSL